MSEIKNYYYFTIDVRKNYLEIIVHHCIVVLNIWFDYRKATYR